MGSYDVVVLGGGIIGASLAEELARRQQRVCLVERGTIGCEASTAAAGILAAQMDLEAPGPFFEFCQASRRMYPAWLRRIERAAGLSTQFRVDGILYLALTAGGVRAMEHRMRWQRTLGVRIQRWSASDVRRREPAASAGVKAGFFFPSEAQLDNAVLMQALARACRKAGVAVREQTEVKGLLWRGRAVAGVRTTRGSIRAPIVVDCLGSWGGVERNGRALRSARHSLAGKDDTGSVGRAVVEPARGQILVFQAPPRSLRHILMSEGAYAVQRRDGRVIVGSTVERAGYDRHVTPAGLTQIMRGFTQMVRPDTYQRWALSGFWAGLRPLTLDRLPVLGLTSTDGLYAAFGHFRHGILLAPMTAQVMADAVVRGLRPPHLAPFSPRRFR